MKHSLTEEDAVAAVWGGAILGGGGGGHIKSALERVPGIFARHAPELWTVEEFSPKDMIATVALVGAPSSPGDGVSTDNMTRSLEILKSCVPESQPIRTVITNENGAETTLNALIYGALTGAPVIDLACNGRAHPLSLMGSMGLHLETGYTSIQSYSGGAGNTRIDGMVSGAITDTSQVVRTVSSLTRQFIAVARNPVTAGYATRHGAPGAISMAIDLGRHYLDGGVSSVVQRLHGRIVAEGEVCSYRCEQKDGLDVGMLTLDNDAATELSFVNEYLTIDHAGQRIATFPDLIVTFSDGRPIMSATLKVGVPVQIVLADKSQLQLSRTMDMPELYAPLKPLVAAALNRTDI